MYIIQKRGGFFISIEPMKNIACVGKKELKMNRRRLYENLVD